jgi:murein DD-endopeptidase MepM/ murein hydrolase activator NlpD
VTLAPGHPIRIGDWGYVIAPDPAAASKSAFEVEISQEHAGLPPGTLVFVPYARIVTAPPAPAASATPPAPTTTTAPAPAVRTPPEHAVTRASPAATAPVERAVKLRHDAVTITVPALKRHGATHEPLTVTPPLHGGPYVFPVAGASIDFGDSYGGERSDVPGGWHHGDDIFAPLGTPVVAVADGTLNRVGWERLGGWRLWVRDRNGDEFYYAHLSGYSPLALARGRVHRGEVIGFVGNTGDAFTTLPHLHFEVHPRQLLHLQYDGAVDPTRYLWAWPRPGSVEAPAPVHPRLPRNPAFLREATVDFGKLLEARGIHPTPAPALPPARLGVPNPLLRAPDPAPVVEAAATSVARGSSDVPVWVGLGAGGAAGAAAAVAIGLWRRRRPAPA